MKRFSLKKLSIVLGSCLLSLSVSAGELYAPRAIFDNTDTNLVAKLRFNQPETGDMYLATTIDSQLLFITPTGLTATPAPLLSNTTFNGDYDILSVNAKDLTPGIYPLYQLITVAGGNPLNVTDWVGGFGGLHTINFMVGMPSNIHGDKDGDGFTDDDLNHDGYHDDDFNRDGYHDNDLNHDGINDDESTTNTTNDTPESTDDNVVVDPDNDGDDDSDEHDEVEEHGATTTPTTTPTEPTTTTDNTTTTTDTITYDGKQLFSDNCTRCHDNGSSIKGETATRIQMKINRNSGGMGIFKDVLSQKEIAAIADYLQTL